MLSPSGKDEHSAFGIAPRTAKDSALSVCIPPPALPPYRAGYPPHPLLSTNLGLWWSQRCPPMTTSPGGEDKTAMLAGGGGRTPSPPSGVMSSLQSPSNASSSGKSTPDSAGSNSGRSPQSSAIKFSIESILSRPDRVRKAKDEGDMDHADSSSDILVNVHDCSSDEMKDDSREETSHSAKDSDENCYNSERYSWLQCTRYKPPKLPRSKKKEGVKKRKLGRNPRVPFTQHQVNVLEQKFRQTHYLSSVDVAELSAALNLTETRVKIWFQNRRARERRDREQPGTERDPSAPADSGKPAKPATPNCLPSHSTHCDVIGLPGMPGMPGMPPGLQTGAAGTIIPWPSPALPRPGALAHFSAAYHHRPSAFTPLTYLSYR